jgi:outer membrane murein-binding lipoprotein Lpp
MIFRLKPWAVSAVLLIAGCSSTQSVHQLTDAQRDTEQMLAQQAERLELQRQHLLALQEERGQILQELSSLRQQLGQMRESQVVSAPQSLPRSVTGKNSRTGKNNTARARPLTDESGKVILGKEEWVWFDLLGRSVKTKVDTGVKSSLIYASDIQLFERDGDQWVRFGLSVNKNGEWSTDAAAVYESPLLRKIRMRSVNGGDAESRPIIRLKIQLGELVDDTEFILVRRDNNEFPVVLARSFLRDIAVVDVSRKYIQDKKSEGSSL